ncbi:MAG TPA: OsmC family protein [Kiritimatiellia bacterium]|nr:OsmC family protein [Kiritimatiellia bacterium]HMO98264.1 OsmC family protein [Kiritimatiellia bacterium]HMP96261.1 OsmC family protein [Kiritimatiellia bacterium]
MVEINGRYESGLRCRLTHGPSGTTIETDAPADNFGKAERFSPTDLIAAALVSCMTTTLAIKTRDRGWDFDGKMRMRVHKQMSADAPRRIVALPVEVWVDLDLDAAARAECEAILAGCPVYKSIAPEIATPLTVHWAATGK